jgi:hypothetical protein
LIAIVSISSVAKRWQLTHAAKVGRGELGSRVRLPLDQLNTSP